MLPTKPIFKMKWTPKTIAANLYLVALLGVIVAESCPTNCMSACNTPDGGCSICKDGWFGRHCNHPRQCYVGMGETYKGTFSKTENGITCQSWSEQQPNEHDWGSLADQKNYCRNPNINAESKPWCYQISGKRHGVCNVPKCENQCPAPALSAFEEIINPPSLGFMMGYVVNVKTRLCRIGTMGQRTCKPNKTWSAFGCFEIPGWCTKPVVPEPSYIADNRDGFYYQNHTTILCRPGYQIIGSDQITCQEDKSWSPIPQCTLKRDLCSKPIVKEPRYIGYKIDNRSRFYYQDNLTILCREGYEIAGGNKITCQANNSWTAIPLCTPVECSHPSLNEGGYVINNKTTYVYLDQITVECHNGYTMKGKPWLTCGADKSWNGTFPTCDPVSCIKPALPGNTLLVAAQKFYVYKDTVNLTCPIGFELNGGNTITCQANKTWSTIPGCTVVECGLPSLEENVFVVKKKATYIYLDEIYLGCLYGYTINGRSLLTCGADKAWNGNFPSCEPVLCSQPILPENTQLMTTQELYVYKDKVNLTCVIGFELKSRNTITCHANKTWGIIPQCTGCRGNQKINGTNTTTCHHTGQWDKINTECIEKTNKDQETANTGLTIGVVIGVATISGFVTLMIFIYIRRRRKRNKFNMHSEGLDLCAHSGNDGKENRHFRDNLEKGFLGSGYVSLFNIAEVENCSDTEKPNANDLFNASKDEQSSCIKIKDLSNYVREKTMDMTFFEREFSKLKTGLLRSTFEAYKPENKPKNKYRDVYPYDDNRVILVKNPSIPGSDFINASEIKGYDGRTKYIATQGPMKTTVIDFWKMIWELNCSRIVMLTNIFEDGKQKCEQYWPDKGTVKMGAMVIELCTTDTYPEFTVRLLSISKNGFKRSIHHFHYSAWPDRSVPSYVYSLGQFRRKVFSSPSQEDGPLVVHCSGGVGRTGTFIAFDYLADEAKAVGSVDIFSCVNKLREQRIDMVQTKEQYVFLHDVLVDEIKCQDLKVSTCEFYSRYKQLLMINPATGTTYLDERYQALNKSDLALPIEEMRGGRRLTAREKNRYCNILPGDANRPFLIDNEGESGDYINAVYLPSHQNKNAFIATQMPLPNTVKDFWTLIYEQDVSVIVMLNEITDKSCGVYWCENENADKTFGQFRVSFAGSQTDNNIIIRTLKVEKKPDKPRTVKQLILTDWPDSVDVPASPSSILYLMDKVQACQCGKQGTPVVVHCLSGVNKSGLFCTVVAIIDRFKVEHDVVIQQIITQMRSRRPQCIPNKKQYHFCHQCVHQYLKNCEMY